MAQKEIIVIGASLGGIKALQEIVSELPSGLPAAIFIVQHTSPEGPGMLPSVLNRRGVLSAFHPRDRELIQCGNIYVAPPDHHLLLENGFVRVTRGPKENRSRPSVDVLFRSAAYAYGTSVIGVVLTGSLDDGSAGLWAIKDRGGTTIVQEPSEAEAPSMPASAMRQVKIDYRVSLKSIAPLLVELAGSTADPEPDYPASDGMKVEVGIAREDLSMEKGIPDLFEPSKYACPECHGVLMKIPEGDHTRYRCHTGHAYSGQSLMSHISETTEDTLWSATRSIQEGALLLWDAAQEQLELGNEYQYRLLVERAEEAQHRADVLRRFATSGKKLGLPATEETEEILSPAADKQ